MGKWRPAESCLFVIPDIHGMAKELELILNRILPLRDSGGHYDTLVFLGDYIDRRAASPNVVDLVREVKQDFPNQVFTLLGNHELLILDVVSPTQTIHQYNMWMHNGGENTLAGYLQRSGSDVIDPYLIPRKNVDAFVPDEHIEFFNSLIPYHETEKYIFVHGGCDPFVPLSQQKRNVLAWDRSVYHHVRSFADNNIMCPWNKTIITGHNGEEDGKPFIWDKFMMLDGSYAERLYVWELNSRTGFSARKGNKRLVRESIT